MLKIYGYSDDNLVVEGADYPFDEISCFDQVVELEFDDGTIINAEYGKGGEGIWAIKITKQGTAKQTLTICDDEDAEIYSDIFEIEANPVSVKKHDMWGGVTNV